MSEEYGQYPAMFEGLPAVVKLVTGETVIAVVLVDEELDQYVLDRPLVITTRPDPDDVSGTIMRFERWVIPSGEIMYPLYSDLVISMTLTKEDLVSKYFQWADGLYEPLVAAQQRRAQESSAEPDEQDCPLYTPPDAQCTTAQREQHYYRLMMIHTPKTGLPN